MKNNNNIKKELEQLKRYREAKNKAQKKFLQDKKSIYFTLEIEKAEKLDKIARGNGYNSIPAMLKSYCLGLLSDAEKEPETAADPVRPEWL